MGNIIKKIYHLPSSKHLVLFSVAGLFIGAGLGFWYERKLADTHIRQVIGSIHQIRENNTNYTYISPLLLYDYGNAKAYLKDQALEAKIRKYINTQYKNQTAQDISVSFRHFPDAHWAGVNQDDQYHPGSMLKVLIMMAYFRLQQINPSTLEQTFLYSKEINNQVNSIQFVLPTQLTVGQSYTIGELIKDMIADSDNGAETLLISNVDHTLLDNVYKDLSIPNPDQVSGDYTISPNQYMDFLRILYNSTYVSEQNSEQALSIMSQSTYKNGIVAGVPQGIAVAHKYGERIDATGSQVQAEELHDCGIIYAPNHPYALCIMTKGTDVAKLTSVLKDISGLVYNYVNAKYKLQ